MRVHSMFVIVVLSALASGCANLRVPESENGNGGKAERAADAGDKSKGLILLAKDIEAHGEKDTAIKLYQQTVTLSGDAPDANVRLGDAYLRASQIKPAMDAYRAALIK